MTMSELDKPNNGVVEKMILKLDDIPDEALTDEQKKEVYERFKKFLEGLFEFLEVKVN